MSTPAFLMLHEAVARIEAGTLSEEELWDACSAQIDRLGQRLGAFITRLEFSTKNTDSERARGTFGSRPLEGTPTAVKDLFETAGVLTTAGSLFFKDHIPEQDAFSVSRVKEAGGRLIGKTNTHEIALGVTSANPHYGVCRNPWDPERVSGGSSGGSAVAVATGMAMGALGTDTGGSIRIPASLCGVVGLKPSRGRVSLRGVIPLSWNLDHAGPLARCVRDVALLLQVLAGYDEADPSSLDVAVADFLTDLEGGIKGWKVAAATETNLQECDPEVLGMMEQAAASLRRCGATVAPVDLSYLKEAAQANGLMTQVDAATFHGERLRAQPDLFGSDVRRRLEAGRDTPVADYVLARRTQDEVRRSLAILLEDYDVLMLPSTPVAAPPISGRDAVEEARRLTRFTAPFNLAGVPAISIPGGLNRLGLPIGLQLVAGPWKEAQLLRAARAYEREHDGLFRRPTDSRSLRSESSNGNLQE